MVWLRSSILVLNTVLCLIYLLLGRLPFFNLGFFYNHRFGVLVSVAILLYITWRCVIQYTSGSIARTELALRYLLSKRGSSPIYSLSCRCFSSSSIPYSGLWRTPGVMWFLVR